MTVLVGVMECGGYSWMTTGATEDEVRATMLAEWRRRVKQGAIYDMRPPDCPDPLEYHGLSIFALTAGEVEWT